MGSLSDYVEDAVLDHVLKTTSWTQPAALWVGLSTADPLDDGSGNAEPGSGAYARVSHDTWDTASARATENTGTITFPEATGSWGLVTHFTIWNASTAGDLIAHGTLSASKTIGNGDNASFQDGAIDVTFNTGGISTDLSNKLLDHIFGNTTYTVPTNIYIGLSIANPTDDGSGNNEHIGDNYSRVNHNVYDASSGGATENDGAVTFPQASASWGTVTYFAMWDNSSAGNMMFYGILDSSRAVGTNDTPSFADGALDITMD